MARADATVRAAIHTAAPRDASAIDALPPRIDTPLLFPAPAGGLLNLDHFRQREWAPAIEASGVVRPVRIYDLRSTFASRAIAAGVPIFELTKIMGTSVRMIERHYGTLLDGSGASFASRLDAYDGSEPAADTGAADVQATIGPRPAPASHAPHTKTEDAQAVRAVPPTGFEPVISCVKGRRPNR